MFQSQTYRSDGKEMSIESIRPLLIGLLISCSGLSLAAQSNQQSGIVQPTEEELARYKRLGELLRHPTFIRLRLISSGRDCPGTEPSTTPTPYTIGESIHFRLFITQDSSENLIIGKGAAPNDYLVKLIRDGDIVSYSKEVQQKVDRIESEPRNPRWSVSLPPGQEYPLDYVSLEDWYDSPLKAGHYQLTVRKQFAPGGNWVESNPVMFDVVPRNAPFVPSQDISAQSDLDQTADKVARGMAAQMPGWQHKRARLIQGSRDVSVEIWTLPNRVVRVSMMLRRSPEDARERLKAFVAEEPEASELKGLGDEAYSWGDGGANIIFRRGKYTVYVSTIADIDKDADAVGLTAEQKSERRKHEMKRLSKEVAKNATSAIDAPQN